MKYNAHRFDRAKPSGANSRDRNVADVEVEAAGKAGEGSFGIIDRVQVETASGKTVGFVRKAFSKAKTVEDARKYARHSVEIYEELRKAGLKNIPATYRLLVPEGGKEEESTEVLMTDLETKETKIYSANPTPREKISIDSLDNLGEIIEALEPDLQKAARAGIYIAPDAYFLVGPKEGGSISARAVISDMDNVQKVAVSPREVYANNAYTLWTGITELLSSRMRHVKETYYEYFHMLEKWASRDAAYARFDAWKESI